MFCITPVENLNRSFFYSIAENGKTNVLYYKANASHLFTSVLGLNLK